MFSRKTKGTSGKRNMQTVGYTTHVLGFSVCARQRKCGKMCQPHCVCLCVRRKMNDCILNAINRRVYYVLLDGCPASAEDRRNDAIFNFCSNLCFSLWSTNYRTCLHSDWRARVRKTISLLLSSRLC